jgi:hypothetical protein
MKQCVGVYSCIHTYTHTHTHTHTHKHRERETDTDTHADRHTDTHTHIYIHFISPRYNGHETGHNMSQTNKNQEYNTTMLNKTVN